MSIFLNRFWVYVALTQTIFYLYSTSVSASDKKPQPSVFCSDKKPIPKIESQYPMVAQSPYESINTHDIVVMGEVLVPAKYCSLGICAGVRVHNIIKGKIPQLKIESPLGNDNILVHITTNKKHPSTQLDCLDEDLLTTKHKYWYLFAHTGTSRRGFIFYEIAHDSPSFPTKSALDFSQLEQHYQQYRKAVDYAIKSRLGLRYQ